jgi:hypothetical protein
MPAQWPLFINNVSTKLSSKNASSIDEFAVFLANEYFNCVKTSQTIYGNIHQSGQKPILESGFKSAFKKIYEEETVMFDDKFNMSTYADLFEKSPGPDTTFDPYCELEKWANENKDNLEKFLFYPFFPSTCPDPNIETPTEIGQIDTTLLEEANKPGEPQRFITMSIIGFTSGIDYRFLYSINGVDQPIQIAINDVLNVPAPTIDGVYNFTFKAVYNNDVLLKEINKSITVDINPQQFEIIEEIKDPFANKKDRPSIPEMTEDERAKNIALRVVYQNDGSAEYGEWVDRLNLGHNKVFGKKVKEEVFKILGVTGKTYEEVKDSVARKKALEKAEEYRKKMIKRYIKQGSRDSRRGVTKKGIEDGFKAEFKRYEKKYKNTLSESDLIKDILSEDKTLKKEDAINKLYSLPIPNNISNPINEYIFQEEHIDNKEKIPSWLEAVDICKFVYFGEIDKRMKGYSDRYMKKDDGSNNSLGRFSYTNAELKRNTEKVIEYLKEKDKWYDLLRKWGNSMTGKVEEDSQGGDGYVVMAQAIIDYWKSCVVQPFKPGPPILPCTSIPPLGGKYAPISYGNKSALANDLRRAWNTGKRFKQNALTPIASKAVASAVAVACAKHLLGVKFLYLGGLIIPVGPPIPMVGFSPTTF